MYLPPPPPTTAIETLAGSYPIGAGRGTIYAKILHGPQFHVRARPPRQAVMIHGEELGANHTLLERPARWLLAREVFDTVILPDRRGCGQSSAVTHPLSPGEMGEDLHRLLGRLDEAGLFDSAAPLTAVGLSLGGLAALSMAAADRRVQCAALLGGSPLHARPGLIMRLLLRAGRMDRWIEAQLSRSLGRDLHNPALKTRPSDSFDPIYDARSAAAMTAVFERVLRAVPAERAESLRLDYINGLDPAAAGLPASLRLSIPILQVTGEGDEVWVTDLPADLRARFPHLTRKTVPGATMHKDVYLKAQAFLDALVEGLREVCIEK